MTELSDQNIKIIIQNTINYSHHLVGLKIRNVMIIMKKTTLEIFQTSANLFFLLASGGD